MLLELLRYGMATLYVSRFSDYWLATRTQVQGSRGRNRRCCMMNAHNLKRLGRKYGPMVLRLVRLAIELINLVIQVVNYAPRKKLHRAF